MDHCSIIETFPFGPKFFMDKFTFIYFVLLTQVLVHLDSRGLTLKEFYSNFPALPLIKLTVCTCMV